MKQYTSLLKKDLFLMGTYLFFIPAITFVLPFFYYWRLPQYAEQKGTGLLILIIASIYSEFLAYEQIFLKDAEVILSSADIFFSVWCLRQPRSFIQGWRWCWRPLSAYLRRNMLSHSS